MTDTPTTELAAVDPMFAEAERYALAAFHAGYGPGVNFGRCQNGHSAYGNFDRAGSRTGAVWLTFRTTGPRRPE